MDIQGAELMALQGLAEKIGNIKIMHLEVEFFEIYKDQPLFSEVKKYLNKKGFLLIGFTTFGKYSADAIFINKIIISSKINMLKFYLIDRMCLLLRLLLSPIEYFISKIRYLSKVFKKRCDIMLKLFTFDRRTWYLVLYKRMDSLFRSNNGKGHSDVPIDIIITVIEKDLDVLPFTINSVRRNVKHPIGQIFIIAPDSERIKLLCNKENCKFLNEEEILPMTKKDINYIVKGEDRSGWLMQQLLKLSGDKICSQEYFLVIDADTILIQPHIFLWKNKTLFLYSDEYHVPYFEIYYKLLGEKIKSSVSFISHYMLFHKPKLSALKNKIEWKNNIPWHSAIINNIDKTEMSGFAEYETYGNFVFSNFPNTMRLEYWFNLDLKRNQLNEISKLDKRLIQKYRAISFHSYNEK